NLNGKYNFEENKPAMILRYADSEKLKGVASGDKGKMRRTFVMPPGYTYQQEAMQNPYAYYSYAAAYGYQMPPQIQQSQQMAGMQSQQMASMQSQQMASMQPAMSTNSMQQQMMQNYYYYPTAAYPYPTPYGPPRSIEGPDGANLFVYNLP